MSDIAEKLLAAIADKEMKAMVADSTAYDDAGDPVTAAGSFSWHVEFDSLSTWVQDGAGENVALASDVDPSMEDWTKMTHGRVEFIADNDPESVLRRCAADREIVEQHCRVWITPGHPEFNDAHLTSEPMPVCASCRPETMFRRADSWPCRTLLALARDYGVTP